MSKVRVRESKIRDLGLFRKLWKQYLEANEKGGSTVAVTDKNMVGPERLFEQYTNGTLLGVVLFIGDYAVLMAGDSGIDHNCGKVAMLWGLFVTEPKRKNGIATLLMEEASKLLKAKGFGAVMTTFTASNEAAGQIALKKDAKPIFVMVQGAL